MEKTYQVQSRDGLCVEIVKARRPAQAVAEWKSRLTRLPIQERDVKAADFDVLPDGFHIVVK